jgi:hypothetical protein
MALVAFPSLLAFLQHHHLPSGPGSEESFARIRATRGAHVHGGGALFAFVLANLPAWLGSAVLLRWLACVIVGSFGLVLLRPHAIAIGLPFTLVPWLMQDELLWPPRFAPSLAFIGCASVLGFASLSRTVSLLRAEGGGRRRLGGAIAALAALAVGAGFRGQAVFRPDTWRVIALEPYAWVSDEDRRAADALFARYRSEARPEESVGAAPALCRYAGESDLYPLDRLGGLKPVWILSDEGWKSLGELGLETRDYDVLGKSGRYALLRARR